MILGADDDLDGHINFEAAESETKKQNVSMFSPGKMMLEFVV